MKYAFAYKCESNDIIWVVLLQSALRYISGVWPILTSNGQTFLTIAETR